MQILYYNTQKNLQFESFDLQKFSEQKSTPFYIYSSAEINNNCNDVLEIAGNIDFLPCYALKANYNPAILKIISRHGFGADVVSGGELLFALKAGVPANKIVFAGVGKTRPEIELAIKTGIHSLNIESLSEMRAVGEVAEKQNKKVRIAIRVNPDINPQTHPYISTGLHSNKFGVTKETAIELFRTATQSPFLMPDGLHVHIGSQIESPDPYLETAEFLKQMINELNKTGIEIKYLDLGGGIGINYKNQLDTDNGSRTHIKKILPQFLNSFQSLKVKLVIELGRSIIGSAGILITKVLYIKTTPVKKFIIVDAAMNNLIRPSLYQAYHQIVPLKNNEKPEEKVDVVGPICETSDFLARDRMLPELKEGNYLAITGAGAYGQALSSNYNLRPTIAEYLVNGSGVRTIFAGETNESLIKKFSWD